MFVVRNAKPSWNKQTFRERLKLLNQVQVQLENSYKAITAKTCQDPRFLDLKWYSDKNPTVIDAFYDGCCLNRECSCV